MWKGLTREISVLLRVLEYSQGIIVLRTNRVGTFDPAVNSSTNLAIGFPYLALDKIIKILDQLKPEWIEDRKDIEDWIEDYRSEYGFNGRQVRNVVSGALALARNSPDHKNARAQNKAENLRPKHFKQFCEIKEDKVQETASV